MTMDCKLNRGKRKGQGSGKGNGTPTDQESAVKFEGECRRCATKGHKWAEPEGTGSGER